MLSTLAGLWLAAAPASVALHHVSDPACPDQAWLESSVTARLGYSPFAKEAPLVARTKAACTKSACEASLELVSANGPPRARTLSGAAGQCRELMESLSLALALALDPQLLTRAPEPRPEQPKPQPEPAKPEPVKPEPPLSVVVVQAPLPEPPPAAPREPVFFQGSVTGHGGFGLSPYPTGGAAVGVGVRYAWFGVLAEGRFDAPRSAAAPTGGSVTSQVLLASLLVCGHFKGLGVCLLGSGGALQVTGNLPQGRSQTSPLLLAGARVLYEWMFVSWLGVHFHLNLTGVATRTTVRTVDGPVWVTGQVAGEAALGLVVMF